MPCTGVCLGLNRILFKWHPYITVLFHPPSLYMFVSLPNAHYFQPENIGSLPALEELWLDCNELQELPPVSVYMLP